jgi:hypothetical protein
LWGKFFNKMTAQRGTRMAQVGPGIALTKAEPWGSRIVEFERINSMRTGELKFKKTGIAQWEGK